MKTWEQVTESAEFKALAPAEQEAARLQYFDQVVLPRVPEEDLAEARAQFDQQTRIRKQSLQGRDKDGNVGPVSVSLAGAGRGFVAPPMPREAPRNADQRPDGAKSMRRTAYVAPASPQALDDANADVQHALGQEGFGPGRGAVVEPPGQRALFMVRNEREKQRREAPYRDRDEAIDDAVNMIDEGADPQQVYDAFRQSPMQIMRLEIEGRGIRRGSPYFSQQKTRAGDGAVPEGMRLLRPDGMQAWEPSAAGEVVNTLKRGGEQVKGTLDAALWNAGATDTPQFAEQLREGQRRTGAAAPSGEVREGMERLNKLNEPNATWIDVAGAIVQPRNWKALAALTAESAVGSAPVMVAGALATALGGAVAGMPTTAAASFAQEYMAALGDELQKRKIDPSDAVAVAQALGDPDIREAIDQRGRIRGAAVGAFDGITMGVAGAMGRTLRRIEQAGTMTRPTAAKFAAGGAAVEMAGGAGGERLAQAGVGDDKKLDVAVEALAEAPSGLVDVAASYFKAPRTGVPRQDRNAALQRFGELAAQFGLSPKAEQAVTQQAATLPADQVPGFLARATAAFAKRGLFQQQPTGQGITALGQALQQMQQIGQSPEDSPAAKPTDAPSAAAAAPAAPDTGDYSGLDEPVITTPVDEAAHGAAASPTNDRPEPTEAQAAAGNYSKGHARISGLDISIENPQGSTRRGVDASGKPWETKMRAHYGYFGQSKAKDGDHVDVFVKAGTPEDFSGTVFVVDQIDPKTGKYDEAKVMLGFGSEEDARAGYLANYSEGWSGLGAITALPMRAFKAWVKSGEAKHPLGDITNARKVHARTEQAPAVSDLEERQGSVQQPEVPVVSQLRGTGDRPASGVGGQLPSVPAGSGAEAQPAAPTGPQGQQQGLRAGQRPLGDQEAAGAQPAQERGADTRGQDAGSGGLGRRPGAGAIDAALPPQPGRDVGRGSAVDAAPSGPPPPQKPVDRAPVAPAPAPKPVQAGAAAPAPSAQRQKAADDLAAGLGELGGIFGKKVNAAAPTPTPQGSVGAPVEGKGEGAAAPATGKPPVLFAVGDEFELDGKPVKVTKAADRVITITGVDGKPRVITAQGVTWKELVKQREKRLQSAPAPAAPAAPRSGPSGYAKHPATVMGSSLLAEVSSRLRGLDPAWLSEFSTRFETSKIDKRTGKPETRWRYPMIPGVGTLFRSGGTQDLQALAEVLEQSGYLEPGSVERDAKAAGERAKDLVRAALNRQEVKTLAQQQADIQAAEDAERAAYYAELDAEAAREAEAERQAIMAEASIPRRLVDKLPDEAVADAAGSSDTAGLMRALGFTEQEIADELAREAAQAPAQQPAAGSAQGSSEGAAADGAGGPAAQPQGASQEGADEGLTLEAQTPEDLRAKADREEAATKAAADARSADQERLRKEAEQRDLKARADQTVDDFQLGQSADQQMSGMGDLFADAPAPSATPDKPARRGYGDLEAIAERLGIKVFKAGGGWHAGGNAVDVPDADVDVVMTGAVSPAHVFAHELGHAVMQKRGVSFSGFPRGEVVKRVPNWDALIAVSKAFRPGVHTHENERFRKHAMKPNEVMADAIAAVLLGDQAIALIRPLMDAVGLNEVDLGLMTAAEYNARPRAASPPAPAADPPTAPAPIQDVGEKIGGARKDRWKERGLDVSDLDAMSESEGATHATKANAWKPNYEALAATSDPVTAAMVKVVYDSLAAKPKADTPQGRRDYVRAMQAVRKVYGAVQSVEQAKDAYQTLREELGVRKRQGAGWVDTGDKDAKRVLFSVYKGRSDPFVFGYNELARARKLVQDGFPGGIEPWTRRFALRQAGGAGVTDRGLQMYRDDSAAAGTPLSDEQIHAGFFEVRTKDGKTMGFAPTKADAEAVAKALYERTKGATDEKAEPERPHLDNLERRGLPQRLDRDVAADDFREAFGWRGVEFGNWAAQDERQRLLNMAYDSLMDLADILNVPPRALSLNGTMGLAFGARGGGQFSAHYEPGKLVINMTKLRGAGALAHEWAHALDHYLGELDRADAYQGKARGASGWHSQDRYSGEPQKRMVRREGKWVSEERMRLENLRPDLARRIDGVMRRLYETPIPTAEAIAIERAAAERWKAFAAKEQDPKIKGLYEQNAKIAETRIADLEAGKQPERTRQSDFAKEAQKLSGKSANGYWLRPTEMFARALESYVFDRLLAMGARSDYLVHGVEQDRFADGTRFKGNPYPSGEERQAINAAFDAMVRELKTREGDDGRVAMFSRAAGIGVPMKDARAAVDLIRQALPTAPQIRLHESIEKAPDALVQKIYEAGAQGDVEAAYHEGEIHVFPGNIADLERLQFVVARHEIRHHGLRSMMGPGMGAILLRIYRDNAAVRELADKKLADKISTSRVDATEEALADLPADQVDKLTGWDRLVAAVRQWLRGVAARVRRLGLASAADAIEPASWTDRDVAALVAKAEGVSRGGTALYRTSGTVFGQDGNPTWYSALSKAIEKATMNAAPAGGWKQLLQGLPRRGVKAEEIEWSGLPEWLALQQGKVTKGAVLEYLAKNGVQVQETVLSDREVRALPEGWEVGFDEEVGQWVVLDQSGNEMGTGDTREEAIENSGDDTAAQDDRRAPKYSQYTLPGGTNYREILLTLPVKGGDKMADRRKIGDAMARVRNEAAPGADYMRLPEYEALQQQMRALNEAPEPQTYKSGHWDQPNILAHIRVNDRTDADGRRVLFVEEIQSDWGQAGKKERFSATAAERPALEKRLAEVQAKLSEMGKQQSVQPGEDELLAEREQLGRRLNAGIPAAPFVGSTDAWVALAIKRVIKLAVDEGYDKVAFVNGEQSAERYDLSRQISRVEFSRTSGGIGPAPTEIGRGLLKAYDLNGREVLSQFLEEPAQAEEYVGKEVAQRLLEQPGKATRIAGTGAHVRSLEGLDLKVGGEGMRAFYDQIVPKVAKEVLRKVGGGQMGSVTLGQPRYSVVDAKTGFSYEASVSNRERAESLAAGWNAKNEGGGYAGLEVNAVVRETRQDQPGFDITPAMRERAAGGMPMFSRRSPGGAAQQPLPLHPGWAMPAGTRFDDHLYKFQDKQVDLRRAIQAVKKAAGDIEDRFDAYLQEELYHGRAAKRVEDFAENELRPLLKSMADAGVSQDDLNHYLHARHAEEANQHIADINPDLPDGGSGMTTAEAQAYLQALTPERRTSLEALAGVVDAMIDRTRGAYVGYSLESKATVDAWAAQFKHYVPLMREDKDGGMGIGQGFSVKGPETRARTGSTRAVVDILANIALQREKAIVRGEKNRVAQALSNLALMHPNPEVWTVGEVPTEQAIGPDGMVVTRVVPGYKNLENVLIAKRAGQAGAVVEQAIVFNADNERAMRMAQALKNLDAQQIEGVIGVAAKITRYLASINTQYNPIFGVTNLVRDQQTALLNLASTPLHGKRAQVLMLSWKYLGEAAAAGFRMDGIADQALWQEFQKEGGTTGFRQMFQTSADRAHAIQEELDPHYWTTTGMGRFFTAGGLLKMPLTTAQDSTKWLFDWLSDYNEALENVTRLAAYKTAIDAGMSKQRAASIAKNLTVNFNRKGAQSPLIGALYAFFNASMQGTARMAQAMFVMEGADIKTLRLSRAGYMIVSGGILIGVLQALALAAAGFDEKDPPEFVRERNLIIPIGGKKYVMVPMPLGFHILPNIGRVTAELAMSKGKNAGKKIVGLIGATIDAFNPVGSGTLAQTAAPSVLDPIVALLENRDWQGRPIAKQSFNPAMPGYLNSKDVATDPGRWIAKAVNSLSGGREFARGALSPTADQIDYLLAQVTGGLGREVSRVNQTLRAMHDGEDLPTYKIPLVGRFYGDTQNSAAQASQFYENLTHLRELKYEHTQLLAKTPREAAEFFKENPELKLQAAADTFSKDVAQMRDRLRELRDKQNPDMAQIKKQKDLMDRRMQRFNELVRRAQDQRSSN